MFHDEMTLCDCEINFLTLSQSFLSNIFLTDHVCFYVMLFIQFLFDVEVFLIQQ